MARIRSIHPDLLVSEAMAELSAELERTFLRLLIHCDDQGRCHDNVKLIKAAIYPLHDEVTAAILDAELDELAHAGKVARYEVGGSRYLCIPSWDEYQHPRHPSEARCPAMPEGYGETPQASRQTHASVGVGEGGGEGEGVPAPPHGARRPATTDDPARLVVQALWERCGNRKPVLAGRGSPFMAAVKIAERFLAEGHDPETLTQAMLAAHLNATISISAVNFQLTASKRNGNGRVDHDADADRVLANYAAGKGIA